MKLQHQADVAAAPDAVWTFLQDTRGVVECLPGAEMTADLGDDSYQGVLHVAIGPLKMNYAGDVTVVERDAGRREMVLDAIGRDKRGSGAVQARVSLTVLPADQGTRIDVVSDLTLTGRIASLGRGVRDVSDRMFSEFGSQLADRMEHPGEPAGSGAGGGAAATARRGGGGEIKVLPLVWSIFREKVADLLLRVSEWIRPD